MTAVTDEQLRNAAFDEAAATCAKIAARWRNAFEAGSSARAAGNIAAGAEECERCILALKTDTEGEAIRDDRRSLLR